MEIFTINKYNSTKFASLYFKEKKMWYNEKEPGGSVLARLLYILIFTHTDVMFEICEKYTNVIIIIHQKEYKINSVLC